MTWITTHDIVGDPEYFLCIQHNGCEELQFTYQRETYICNISTVLEFCRGSNIIPIINSSFIFVVRSDIHTKPYKVTIKVGTNGRTAAKHIKSLCLACFDILYPPHVAQGVALGCYQPQVHGLQFMVHSLVNHRPCRYHVLESRDPDCPA